MDECGTSTDKYRRNIGKQKRHRRILWRPAQNEVVASIQKRCFSCQCPHPQPQRLCAHGLSCLARPCVTPSAFPCFVHGLASTATYALIINDADDNGAVKRHFHPLLKSLRPIHTCPSSSITFLGPPATSSVSASEPPGPNGPFDRHCVNRTHIVQRRRTSRRRRTVDV